MIILSVLQGVGIPTCTFFSDIAGRGKWGDLLSLDSGMAAVSSIIVAVSSVVDGITVIITHERLTAFDAVKDFWMRVPLQTHSTHDVLNFRRIHPVMSENADGCHVTRQDDHIIAAVST